MSVDSPLQDQEISSREYTALRDEMSLLRQALAALTAEVTVLRVAQAMLAERIGRPGYASVIAGAIVTVSVLGSIATMTYWGGQLSSRMETSMTSLSELRGLVNAHHAADRDCERMRTLKKEDWE